MNLLGAPVRNGFTLIELMIVIAIIALIATIAIPGLLASSRSANERNASASLKTLAAAQADFRANDLDGNRVRDFWVGDIAGLYCIDNSSTGAPVPIAIKRIDVSIALADGFPAAGTLSNGNYGTPVNSYGPIGSKAGYRYGVLLADSQVAAEGGNGVYAQDTDGTGDMVHNTARFAFGCGPTDYGSEGNSVFILNQSNTMFRRDFGGDLFVNGVPTGLFDMKWPTDASLAAAWSKLD